MTRPQTSATAACGKTEDGTMEPTDFDARLSRCSQHTRDLLNFLRTVAENAGQSVEAPTFDAKGEGITFWANGKRFCRLDPKHQAGHVWALVPSAERSALEEAGVVSARNDGPWVTVTNMHGAVRLVPLVLKAYDTAIGK